MNKFINKSHWYDGWFYDNFIAPNQDRLFKIIEEIIVPNSSVIDIGCGTGRLAFKINKKTSKIVGIDLSQKNIEKAKHNLLKNPCDKISFQHSSIDNIISQKLHFDYAVLTYVIHEVNPDEREKLLSDISKIADKIIIGDYLVPRQKGFWECINEIVEFIAGNEHYNNFKNFAANGGLLKLANKLSFEVINEIKNKPFTSHLIVVKKKENS